MNYIATFFTHFGAMSFKKLISSKGGLPKVMPVPRQLSASCGICVAFDIPFTEDMAEEDLEKVYRIEDNGYVELFSNED